MTEIICLSGFARSGKDEAADVLVREFGFRKVSYADKLRSALYVLNPVVPHDTNVRRKDFQKSHRYLRDVIDESGWNGYKETPYGQEIRRLIQTLGTEVGRDMLGKNIWIDATLEEIKAGEKVCIPDGRFFNEFDAARERGGYVWRIDREGVGPANGHSSELDAVGYENFSLRLYNNGSVEEWRDLVRSEYRKGLFREW